MNKYGKAIYFVVILYLPYVKPSWHLSRSAQEPLREINIQDHKDKGISGIRAEKQEKTESVAKGTFADV